MSHSGDLLLVAITQDRAIGVDVEYISAIADMKRIATRYFSAPEQAFLEDTVPIERGFYVCWTRKEAYIKAIGKGLSVPLTSFDTSMALNTPGRQLPWTADSPDVQSWWLTDLQISEEYAGALVTEGEMPQVTYRNWK